MQPNDNEILILRIEAGSQAQQEILTAELGRILAGDDTARLVDYAPGGDRLVPGDIMISLAASGSLYVLATALRDFVRKRHVNLKITRATGEQIEINGSGQELNELSDLVGFLEGAHHKATNEIRQIKRTENTSDKRQLREPNESN